jgi:DNA-binding CsgD family transcriptional regulator/endogenous inhibitor of DNA gyrase (YacG/DUF329 family)
MGTLKKWTAPFLFMGEFRMTENQKQTIIKMRLEGTSYSAIAAALDVSENTIKSFCRRNGLNTKTPLSVRKKISKVLQGDVCKQCGESMRQKPKSKPKMFCSDKCRRDWWKAYNSSPNRKAFYHLTCYGCGKEFNSYGNSSRKYCSHDCYIQNRFNTKARNANDTRAV